MSMVAPIYGFTCFLRDDGKDSVSLIGHHSAMQIDSHSSAQPSNAVSPGPKETAEPKGDRTADEGGRGEFRAAWDLLQNAPQDIPEVGEPAEPTGDVAIGEEPGPDDEEMIGFGEVDAPGAVADLMPDGEEVPPELPASILDQNHHGQPQGMETQETAKTGHLASSAMSLLQSRIASSSRPLATPEIIEPVASSAGITPVGPVKRSGIVGEMAEQSTEPDDMPYGADKSALGETFGKNTQSKSRADLFDTPRIDPLNPGVPGEADKSTEPRSPVPQASFALGGSSIQPAQPLDGPALGQEIRPLGEKTQPQVGGELPQSNGSAKHQTLMLARDISLQTHAAVTPIREGVTEVSLTPGELGKLRLVISTTDTGIAILVNADRPETHDLLRRHPDILREQFSSGTEGDVTFSFDGSAGGDAKESDGETALSSINTELATVGPTQNKPLAALAGSDASLNIRL